MSDMELYENLSIQDIDGEIWLPVVVGKLFDGKYSVSNMGRVKRNKRQRKNFNGGEWYCSESILKQHSNDRGNGYMVVGLSDGAQSKSFLVHRLVAKAFISNEGNLKTVNHKNFNTKDNRAVNLEWMSAEENNQHYHCVLVDKMDNGERVSNYRFTKEEVIDIFTSPLKYKDISEKYNVNWITIKNIRMGHTYGSITRNLPKNHKRKTKLTIEQVHDIYANRNLPVRKMMDKYGIKQGTVIAVRTGRRYSEITGHKRSKLK